MEKCNIKEQPKIIVPSSYSFDADGKALRREGQIVKNVWRNNKEPDQEQVNAVIRTIMLLSGQ